MIFSAEDIVHHALRGRGEAQATLQLTALQLFRVEGHLRGAVVTVLRSIDVPARLDCEAEDEVNEIIMTANRLFLYGSAHGILSPYACARTY